MILANNQYAIQNIAIEDLCQQYGTPLYVYDGAKIEEKINLFKASFKGIDFKIKFACKALTNISILKLMLKNGVDVDVVSIQEAQIALKAGYSPNQIQYTPSGVAWSEIEEAVALGLHINLDSIPVLEKFGQVYGSSKPVSIRINPYVLEGGNFKISTAHKDSKFGISYEQIDQVYELTQKYGIKMVGLHQHTGSDIKNASAILQAADVLFGLAQKYFPDLEMLDLGGGFKVAYKENDHITDMEEWGKEVVKAFSDFSEKYGKQIQVWFEPGKFLVSECGFLFVRANVVKHNPSRNFVGVDSGLNHLIRPMMYDAFHDIINISNPSGEETEKYDIVGYICETDTLGADRTLPVVKEGDILGIKNAGAYGITMASNYNSRPRPAEVLIYNGKAHLIRERETLEDLLKNQIAIEL